MAEFAWLIEAPGPRYLMARKLAVAQMHEFVWTADHNKALRFYSEEQADRTMMAIRSLSKELFAFEATLGNAKAVEHGWISDKPAVSANAESMLAAETSGA